MSKASEYGIFIEEGTCYLAKIVPSLNEKGQISQDRRKISSQEVYKIFNWYLNQYCNANHTNKLRVMNGRRLVFEARRPYRKKGGKK